VDSLTRSPEEDNYSHSVIAVLKDGQRVTKSADVGKKAKKEFKQIISDMSLVLRRPKAQTNVWVVRLFEASLAMPVGHR
jgi:hypothetical protein